MLALAIAHSHLPLAAELRVDPSSTSVGDLKERMHLMTGTSPAVMTLISSGRTLAPESAMLVSFPEVMDSKSVLVRDEAPYLNAGISEECPENVRFKLSEEEYEKRDDSFRKFKAMIAKKTEAPVEAIKVADERVFKVGDRCEIDSEGFAKRGKIAYVGSLPDKADTWIGIVLDEPYGKHDGIYNGVRYFECPMRYGVFVRPNRVQVGDFPEQAFSDEEF